MQGFDQNSAFFTKVVNKKKKVPVLSDAQPTKQKKDKKGGGDKSDDDEDLDPKTLRSRQLASMYLLALSHMQIHFESYSADEF